MPNTFENSTVVTLTIALDGHAFERLKKLATAKGQSTVNWAQAAVLEQLQIQTDHTEFLHQIELTMADFERTGIHITLDELQTWVDASKANPQQPLPACHP